MIYTVPSDTSSLYLPTIKQSQVVTNGPHARGITAPRDPALSRRPLKLIHPSLAAQVGVDKSSECVSQLQGHHSMEREDCLEFLNFIFYWKSWQCWATDLRRSTASNLSAQPTSWTRGSLSSNSTGLGVQPSWRGHGHRGGRVQTPSTPSQSYPIALLLSCP